LEEVEDGKIRAVPKPEEPEVDTEAAAEEPEAATDAEGPAEA
jgi:hypothetical protein